MVLRNLIFIDDPEDVRLAQFRNIRERDIVGRDEGFIIEGRVVLEVMVSHRAADLAAVLILQNRASGLESLIGRVPAGVPVYVAPNAVIDKVAGFHVHRGVLAVGRKKAQPQLDVFLQRMPDTALVVVAAGISNHDNMGSIFRNAAAFDADGVVLDAQSCDPHYRKSIRVSVGAVLKVPFCAGPPLKEICECLTRADFALAALSPHGGLAICEMPGTGRRALIVGTEGEGLPMDFLGSVPSYRIAMSSSFDSLNVATATGIALFHASGFSK